MYLFFNNTLIQEQELKIAIGNRSFNYGDGVFETMAVKKGQMLYLNDHWERMAGGAAALSINLPDYFSPSYLQKSIQMVLEALGLTDARIKLHVWRKEGGLFFAQNNLADFLITAGELKPARNIRDKAAFFDAVPKAYSAISKYKTCNALPYILAAAEAQRKGMDDMILLDVNCNISECTSSNLFWEKEAIIYTPSLQSACIDGVMRKQLLNFFKAEGIKYEEGLYTRAVVEKADLVFTSNIAGVSCIGQIEGKNYATTSALFSRIKNRFS